MENNRKVFEDTIHKAWADYPEIAVSGSPESGGMMIQSRLRDISAVCVKTCSGDLLEIGTWRGWTTAVLGSVAARFARKVIAVDPYPDEEEYLQFLAETHHYRSVIDLYKTESQDPLCIDMILNRRLSFAFVDGMHTYEAVKVDLETVRHCCGVIAVDDVSWNAGILRAVEEEVAQGHKTLVLDSAFRECYLI